MINRTGVGGRGRGGGWVDREWGVRRKTMMISFAAQSSIIACGKVVSRLSRGACLLGSCLGLAV